MIQKGKNRGFRTIRHIIVDSEIAQSVNTFPELNILGSYVYSNKYLSVLKPQEDSAPYLTLRIISLSRYR
jgi:hypothetical protein